MTRYIELTAEYIIKCNWKLVEWHIEVLRAVRTHIDHEAVDI